MGAQTARDWSEQIALKRVKLEHVLVIHLTSNCYPPLPTSLVPCCVIALKNAEKGLWDKNIMLPKGITYRGKRKVSTSVAIESWRIEHFIGNV
jgi:hypothetical protein